MRTDFDSSGASQTSFERQSLSDRPAAPESSRGRGAIVDLKATDHLSPGPAPDDQREGASQARDDSQYGNDSAPPASSIDAIRQLYRLAKSAEDTRNRLYQGVVAFVRVNVTGWHPSAEKAERKRLADQAARVVKQALRELRPLTETGKPIAPYPGSLASVPPALPEDVNVRESVSLIEAIAAPWWRFEVERHHYRSRAEALASELPAAAVVEHIAGFSLWGLVALIGEAGDIGQYAGPRKLYKRLGLAPDECYPRGESKGGREGGRKIPRSTRGRIMGIIADSLLRAQWRGETDDEPAHAIGPYGKVYGEAKARQLESGKTKLHSEKLARRAMIKALIHDVHRAWHGKPTDFLAGWAPITR